MHGRSKTPHSANDYIRTTRLDRLTGIRPALFANLGWLLLLLPGFATQSDTAIDFWQIYFLTLPHRWITLVLVVTDGDRRGNRSRILALVAGLAAVFVLGAYLGTGAFLCLAFIDYIWNGWHFGSQHAGVLRMYSRKVGGGSEWLERWGIRGFILCGSPRAAGWATGWIEADASYLPWLQLLDLGVLTIPGALVVSNLIGFTREQVGKLTYLCSVCLLYTGFILSLQLRMGARGDGVRGGRFDVSRGGISRGGDALRTPPRAGR